MTRDEYKYEFMRLRRHRELRHNSKMPRDVFEFGWSVARNKPQSWLVNRMIFWMYAYDRKHIWVMQDFLYEVNDDAYEKAKEMRRRRKEGRRAYAIEKANRTSPPPAQSTTWEECKGGLQKALDRLGFNSIEEAIFGNKRRGK